jgi:hypothetical protein
VRGVGREEEDGEQRGEMAQTMYAYLNKEKKISGYNKMLSYSPITCTPNLS